MSIRILSALYEAIRGIGTSGTIAKFTGNGTVGNSTLTQTGTGAIQVSGAAVHTSGPGSLEVGSTAALGQVVLDSPSGAGNGPNITMYQNAILVGQIGPSSGLHNTTVKDLEFALNTGIFVKITLSSVPAYANNAAALAGGLTAGNLYRTNGDPDTVCIVH